MQWRQDTVTVCVDSTLDDRCFYQQTVRIPPPVLLAAPKHPSSCLACIRVSVARIAVPSSFFAPSSLHYRTALHCAYA